MWPAAPADHRLARTTFRRNLGVNGFLANLRIQWIQGYTIFKQTHCGFHWETFRSLLPGFRYFRRLLRRFLPAKVGMWPSKTGHQVHANTTHHVWWEMTAEMFKICQGCISMTNRGQYSRKWKCNPKPVVVLTVGIFRGWCINCCSTVAKKLVGHPTKNQCFSWGVWPTSYWCLAGN